MHLTRTIKFLVKLFSKSLQGIKGGGAPFGAALRAALFAMRSKKRPCQPKTAKRIFGGPGSQGPSGQVKERMRILPVRRGFSVFGVPRHLPEQPLFRSLPLVCPSWAGCAAFLSYFFAFFCLTFASQNSFHLSLRPRRASTFFRKESRQRFAKGLRPFEPHSCALRPIFFSSALLAGLHGLSGRKPPAGRETLEKPRSRAQLFKRFCAKENACALRLISPFFSLLAGLHGPLGRKPPAGKGNARKAKGAELSFSGVSVRWGTFGPTFYVFMEVWRGLLSGRFPSGHREQGLGFFPARENRSPARATHPESTACVRGWEHATNPVRELPTAGASGGG